MKLDYWLYIVVAVAVCWGAWSFLTRDDDGPSDTSERGYMRSGIETAEHTKKKDGDKSAARRRRDERNEERRVRSGGKSRRERPVLDDADETELNRFQKSVMDQLKAALADNDIKGVRRAIAKFRLPKEQGGLGGDIPKVMRSHAVSALGWFGSAALSDLAEFMADIDPEIEEDAFAKFELALDDWDLSDRDRAAALKSVLRVLHDTDRIDSMLMTLNNMRNSVKGDTIISILSSSSSEAQTLMREQLELYTDFDVTDAGGVGKWMQENPDNEWDEEFYGAQNTQ